MKPQWMFVRLFLIFSLIAGCSSMQNQSIQAQQSSRTPSNSSVSNDDNQIDERKAIELIGSGKKFSIVCRRSGAEHLTNIEFYENVNGKPKVSKYLSNYGTIAKIFKHEFSFQDVNKYPALKVVETQGFKYWVTPFEIRHITDEVKIDSPSNPSIVSIRKLVYDTCHELLKNYENPEATMDEWEKNEFESGYTAEESYNILSAVGPYLSYSVDSSNYMGGAHPMSLFVFETVNAEKTSPGGNTNTTLLNTRYSLLDISNQNEVLNALKKDKFLQKRLTQKSLNSKKTLAEVHQLMREKMNDCDISIDPDMTKTFSQIAIFDYQPKSGLVSVRMGFPYGCDAARGNFTQLGIILKPNPRFKTVLDGEIKEAAKENRKPYFMRYAVQLKN